MSAADTMLAACDIMGMVAEPGETLPSMAYRYLMQAVSMCVACGGDLELTKK